MTRNSILLDIFLIIFFCNITQVYANAELDQAFKKKNIVISSSNQTCTHITVWVAGNPKQQARGLMFIKMLPENTGMLFIYPDEKIRSMWMKNTFISLDMLFIDENGYISSIQKNTEPLSLKTINSKVPVKYVLELASGVADQLKLEKNDQVFWLNSE
ncbi:MAG: DUF192 domain-containing protein [Pseudomonadota bacterium]|nr:DUF192 domain-containing protein [Pseudomonadota bacterium]